MIISPLILINIALERRLIKQSIHAIEIFIANEAEGKMTDIMLQEWMAKKCLC